MNISIEPFLIPKYVQVKPGHGDVWITLVGEWRVVGYNVH